MAFTDYHKARKFLLRAGVGAAPLVIIWHMCPKSEERPLNIPPEHIERHAYHPIETNRIEMLTSASSSTANLAVRVDAEHVRVGDRLFKGFPID